MVHGPDDVRPPVDLPPAEPGSPARRWRFRDFLLVVVLGLVANIAAGVFWYVSNLDLTSLSTDGGTLPTPPLVYILGVMVAAQYGGHLLGLLWVARRRRATLTDDLAFVVEPQDVRYIGLGMVLQVALGLLAYPIYVALGVEESPQAVTDILAEVPKAGPAAIALAVLAVAVIAPVIEELMFRGLLLRYYLERGGERAALVWSAALFALFHVVGFSAGGNPTLLAAAAVNLVQLFLVGLVLARLVVRSGRLGPAIFTHAGVNLLAVIALIAVGSDLPV